MRGKNPNGVQGAKTTGRQKEILEGGGEHDAPKASDAEAHGAKTGKRIEPMSSGEQRTNLSGRKGRQFEFPVSRGGMNQESRQHNKPRASE
jgi:hypothetical protein